MAYNEMDDFLCKEEVFVVPTMNDVAKLAGVSRGTVSNYINGVKVKPDSHKKVKEAIETLNYVPNIAARELKSKRSNLVVFILPNTLTPFFAELVYNMQQELKEANFKMLLCNSNNQIDEELEYIQMAKEQKVAGVITISYSDLSSLISLDFPIVSIEYQLDEAIPCVSSDNYAGGRLAAEMLQKKGATKLLLITRRTNKTQVNYGKRAKGFIDYCKEYHLAYEVFESIQHEEEFYPELSQFLSEKYTSDCPFDGIFTVSDQYADFSLSVLNELGYQVPEKVQLVGFDGGKMYPQQQTFISSIRQPIKEITHYCVETVKKIGTNKSELNTDIVRLPVHFIEGKTTK